MTGAFSLAVSGLTHRWGERARAQENLEAQARSRREQLRDACHGYLTAATKFYHAVHQMYLKAIDDKPFDPWEDVREQLDSESYQARDELRAAMRSALGIHD